MKPMSSVKSKSRKRSVFLLWIISNLLLGFSSPLMSSAALPGEEEWEAPLGLDGNSIVIPKDNPLTKEKIELGKLLFFDKRLPKNNTIAWGIAICRV